MPPFSGMTRMQKSLIQSNRPRTFERSAAHKMRLKRVRLHPKSVSLKMHSQRINIEGRHAFKNSHCNGLDHRNLINYKLR